MNPYWLSVCAVYGIVMGLYKIGPNNPLFYIVFLLMVASYATAHLKKY